MSLRVKIEVVLVVVLGLGLGLSYGFQRLVLLPQLIDLERTAAQYGMQRCITEIGDRVSRLDDACLDWSISEPLKKAVSRGDYADEVFSGIFESIGANGIGFAYIVQPDGKVLWRHVVDLASGEDAGPGPFPADQWSRGHPLLQEGNKSQNAGVYLTNTAPLIVARRPLAGAQVDSSASPVLLLGQLIDDRFLLETFQRTQVAFRLWGRQDPAMPPEDAETFEARVHDFNVYVREAGDDLIQAYATIPDIFGAPGLHLRSDVTLTVFPQAQSAINVGLLLQLVVGSLVVIATILITRFVIMAPLDRLTNRVTTISRFEDLTTRIEHTSQDEIGVLATAFDGMLQRLEKDRSQRATAEEALKESEERYFLAVEAANDGVWDWNIERDEIYFSPRWKAMLGLDEGAALDGPDTWWGRIHADDLENVKESFRAHLSGQTTHFESEYRIRHQDGSYIWVTARGLAVRNDQNKATRIAGSQSDITAQKSAEEQLTHEALYDSLTSLPNRTLLMERLSHCITKQKRRQDTRFAVLFLDLDRFKVINDSLGHIIGDQLLKTMAEKLQSSIRTSDMMVRFSGTVARIGGDEFVILLEDLKDASDATRVAERIHRILKEPFLLGEQEVFTTTSIGIALSGKEYTRPEDFLRDADTAMYRAKARGKACHEIFDAEMHAAAIERLELETDLRKALERNELTLRYQAIVDLNTLRISGFEALVRWEHPTKGIISPVDFLPIAEEMGLFSEMEKFILRKALAQVGAWQRDHPDQANLKISVNLSPRQFADQRLVSTIQEVLEDEGFDARCLNLELTETAIIENLDVVAETLNALTALKISVSLDDFGTGYSSLSHLHRLPINVVKIDRSFVEKMLDEQSNMKIVESIILLAGNLGMEVVAEGVETVEQLSALKKLGCSYGQGYYFSRPIDADEVETLLLSDPSWAEEESLDPSVKEKGFG